MEQFKLGHYPLICLLAVLFIKAEAYGPFWVLLTVVGGVGAWYTCKGIRDERDKAGIQKDFLRSMHSEEAFRQSQDNTRNLMLSQAAERSLPDLRPVKTGTEYEKFCCDLLTYSKWTVEPTKASGDQGADIIATSFGKRIVIQCKFYSKPVGNRAVQEVYAASLYYRADWAVVLSNQSFTPAAYELARACGVRLLHHNEIPQLRSLLKNTV